MSKKSIPDFEIGAQLVPQLRHKLWRNCLRGMFSCSKSGLV